MLPNLLLAGPPKCGTSSMFDWLCLQPEVQGTTPKETFMLMDEGHPLSRGDGGWRACRDAAYRRVVPQDSGAPVVVDGTTHHIFQRTARENQTYSVAFPRVHRLARRAASRLPVGTAVKNQLKRRYLAWPCRLRSTRKRRTIGMSARCACWRSITSPLIRRCTSASGWTSALGLHPNAGIVMAVAHREFWKRGSS